MYFCIILQLYFEPMQKLSLNYFARILQKFNERSAGFLKKVGTLCILVGQFVETSQENQVFYALNFLSEYRLSVTFGANFVKKIYMEKPKKRILLRILHF